MFIIKIINNNNEKINQLIVTKFNLAQLRRIDANYISKLITPKSVNDHQASNLPKRGRNISKNSTRMTLIQIEDSNSSSNSSENETINNE